MAQVFIHYSSTRSIYAQSNTRSCIYLLIDACMQEELTSVAKLISPLYELFLQPPCLLSVNVQLYIYSKQMSVGRVHIVRDIILYSLIMLPPEIVGAYESDAFMHHRSSPCNYLYQT